MIAIRTLLASCLALAATGCSLAPMRPLDIATTAASYNEASLESRAIADAFERSGRRAPVLDGQLNLDVLTQVAWVLRAEEREAHSLAVAAGHDARAARKRPNPGLSLTSEFVRNAATGTSPWIVVAAFSWLLENPALRGARIAQADARARALHWAEVERAWQTRAEVRAAVLRLALARHSLAVLGDELALGSQSLALAESRVQAGSASRLESVAAQGLVAQTKARLESVSGQVGIAEAELAAAVGVPRDALPVAQLALPDIAQAETVAPDLPLLLHSAQMQRLDVAQAVARFDEASAALRGQRARRFGGITLSPSRSSDRGDRKIGLGVSGELPIFDRYTGAAQAASAQADAASARVASLQIQASGRIERAVAALAAAKRGLASIREARSAQRGVVALAEKRWRGGLSDRGSWLNAAQQSAVLAEQEIAQLSALLDALAALEEAAQRPVWPHSGLGYPSVDPEVPRPERP
jgi:outer membrane protein TolC